jgi:hypothetical protein
MSKEKKPRKPRTQPKGELVPPARRPPTAVGADTLPPREPSRPHLPERVHQRPVLYRFVQGLRQVAGALLDLADGVADAITSRIP